MHIVCPHCQAAYQLEDVDESAILVCHRCGAEFGFGQPPEDAEAVCPPRPNSTEDDVLPLFSAHSAIGEEALNDNPEPAKTTKTTKTTSLTADDPVEKVMDPPISAKGASDDESPSLPPPPRAKARVMPWLLTVILLIAAAGFWFKHDAWLDDPWLRSVLLNVGLPVEVRDKDWRIQPESVRAQWVKRNDGSQVLVIEGRVKNLLQSEIPPPFIHVSIFDKDNPKHLLIERELPILQPPLMPVIRHSPYVAPPEDHIPVRASGDLGFVLVLENLPKNTGEFTLTAIAKDGA